MLGIGSTELVIILVFGFLLFGPDKLPQMGRTIGRALRQFRETQEKLTAVVQTEVVDPMAEAAKKPIESAMSASSSQGHATDSPTAAPGEDEPARKETFAERRARLAAARVERQTEQAAKGQDAPGADENPATGESPADDAGAARTGDRDASPAEEPLQEAVSEDRTAVRTTEDLYARRPRKRKPASDDVAADAAPDAAVAKTGAADAALDAAVAENGAADAAPDAAVAEADVAAGCAPLPAETPKGGER